MKSWHRTAPLDAPTAPLREEVWMLRDGTRTLASHTVAVLVGKPLDVVALKRTSLDETLEYARYLKTTAARLYGAERASLGECPCCGYDASGATAGAVIFGVTYHRCEQCAHAFVRERPTEALLNEVFAESEQHSATYTDKAAAEVRLEQVIAPKVQWMSDVYRTQFGKAPRSALDVGAGGGHFVAGLQRAGIAASGFELSRASRTFAKEVFGIELNAGSFIDEPARVGEHDVITFWGLLEYVSEPRRFLDAARKRLAPDAGMLVMEVPRYDCMGTAIQALFPDRVARHLDPTSHINCFSDSAIATALHGCGFKPVAAWYFGMDAYELLSQLAIELGEHAAFDRLAGLIPALQTSLDSGLLCDDIVVAAVPV
jgi:2-polyprenyl-3-methyl-5-hydroxy-6-metoxy-1,4-benzoquinol methylase